MTDITFFAPVKRIVLLLVFLCGISITVPGNSLGQQDDTAQLKQLFKERDAEIKTLLGPKGTEYTQEQRNRLKDIINGIIDYREMAQIALQGVYDTLSQETRDEFVNLFSTVIRDQSLNRLDIYRAEVTYNKFDVKNDSAVVNTVAQLDKVRTPVIYKMKKNNDRWVVVDMVIDDVSTAESYQRQFSNIIRKKGFDSLMETLRKRANRSNI